LYISVVKALGTKLKGLTRAEIVEAVGRADDSKVTEELTNLELSVLDFLIERGDRVVNLCEIKYAGNEYEIDKEYEANLRNKRVAFESETKTRLTPS